MYFALIAFQQLYRMGDGFYHGEKFLYIFLFFENGNFFVDLIKFFFLKLSACWREIVHVMLSAIAIKAQHNNRQRKYEFDIIQGVSVFCNIYDKTMTIM